MALSQKFWETSIGCPQIRYRSRVLVASWLPANTQDADFRMPGMGKWSNVSISWMNGLIGGGLGIELSDVAAAEGIASWATFRRYQADGK